MTSSTFPLTYDRHIYSNCLPGTKSIAMAEYIKHQHSLQFIICDNAQDAERLSFELDYLLPDHEFFYFPDLETLPYDHFSASEDILSRRLKALYSLSHSHEKTVLITAAGTLMKRLPPPAFITQYSFRLKKGDHIKLEKWRLNLERGGYHFVNQVLSRGEFSIRGGIIDIFPMGADSPYRIDLFDDEIDSLRAFDIDTQRSRAPIDNIEILPTQEFIFDKKSLDNFAINWSNHFDDPSTQTTIYREIMAGNSIGGIEYYLPFFYEETASIFDYLPHDAGVHISESTSLAWSRFNTDINARYQQLAYDVSHPILKPELLYLSDEALNQQLKPYRLIKWLTHTKSKSYALPVLPINDIRVQYQRKQPYQLLLDFLKNHRLPKVIFSTDSAGRREILIEHLNKIDIHVTLVDSWQAAMDSNAPYLATITPLSEGFILTKKWVLITEQELFSHHMPLYQRRKQEKYKERQGAMLKDLSELTLNSPVVHIEHGIGRYLGLTRLDIGSGENEFLTIGYQKEQKLYVPINDLQLISRYSGTDIEHAPLHALGTDKWQKQKEKAARKISDVAAELLHIYAERELKQGFGNRFDENAYLAFCEGFPFEETEDQLTAINEVMKDMIAPKPMDRLVCGDVGFGKTEVAMRAAFMAVYNNKQVVVLVPTTLLAQQHYDNFKDRFADMAINVGALSRFNTAKQQNEIINQLKMGQIDIIIGTHKLLSNKIQFANLGLLIIDEEHRFGVAHKEKMQAMRANIDILTMTATPIPSTLNMAFSEIRALSVISTPPAKRLSVKTFIHQQNNSVIKEAILRETLRGGQVYYLHNQVETIFAKQEELQSAFPELKIAAAHGQMRERELEKIMFDFQHKRHHVLICTTIIETGIDIANANTIIIERADKFGLAQLHQLRGRVGRSHHQAYAYLLTPPEASLGKDAKKRLEAISQTASIGGGFMLASHDLEIRGAGELLGKEQSGNMEGIGFNLYMDLLNKTISALRRGEAFNITEITHFHQSGQIELRIPALLPDDYIFDVHTRLSFYKRIAEAENEQALTDIKIELIDRFGKLPEAAHHLLKVTEFKLQAIKLGIEKIEIHSQGGRVEFSAPLPFNPIALIILVQMQPGDFQLSKDQKLLIKKPLIQAYERIDFVQQFLEQLQQKVERHGKD
ncbi:MAG: transcription-repair coupling factor [Francisellaceae bacterium]